MSARTDLETQIDNLDLGDRTSLEKFKDLLKAIINLREPIQQADSAASNGTIYYSTTQSKLVFKDLAGVVKDLY
jgi:hypothetical protein